MAKEFVANKLIISFDGNNDFDGGVLVYKLRIDGIMDTKFRSIGINNMGFSKLDLTKILKHVVNKTKEGEGLQNED